MLKGRVNRCPICQYQYLQKEQYSNFFQWLEHWLAHQEAWLLPQALLLTCCLALYESLLPSSFILRIPGIIWIPSPQFPHLQRGDICNIFILMSQTSSFSAWFIFKAPWELHIQSTVLRAKYYYSLPTFIKERLDKIKQEMTMGERGKRAYSVTSGNEYASCLPS